MATAKLVRVLAVLLAVGGSVLPGSTDAQQRTVALLPVAHENVADVVPLRAAEILAEVAVGRGYTATPSSDVAHALGRLGLASASPTSLLPPAELFRLLALTGSARGIACHVYVENEQYAADLLVGSLDGAGPFRAHVTGGPEDFLDRLREAAYANLPPPETFDDASASRYRLGAPATSPRFAEVALPPPPPPPMATGRGRRFGATFFYETAIGNHQSERFHHHFVGGRLDVHLRRTLVMGFGASYVNLDLGADRGSNLVGFVQLEDRMRFFGTRRVVFPIRIAVGYMPRNGPVLRFSGGIRVPLVNDWEMGFDLVAPTFFFVPGDRRTSYDVAAEVTYRFGREEERR